MKDYGWVKYDPLDCVVVRVQYKEDGWTKICQWVKYDLEGSNPKATGTEGLIRAIYKTNLHTNPHPAPNYGDPCHFHNDTTHSRSST